jgi:hypothetical protein
VLEALALHVLVQVQVVHALQAAGVSSRCCFAILPRTSQFSSFLDSVLRKPPGSIYMKLWTKICIRGPLDMLDGHIPK